MSAFSPFEVQEKLEKIGKEALLKEIPSYNHLAQEFYYKTILEIENSELEGYKVTLQKEANKIAASANCKAGIAIAISIISFMASAVATIYSVIAK